MPRRCAALRPDPAAELNILYGCGAALAGWDGLLVYVDVPKNEIQFRFRAGSVANLGMAAPADPKAAYKRCYFVDWVAANGHKAALLPRIDCVVDEQRPDEPALMGGGDLRAALAGMAHSYFRVRPWFEPGPWGGQWIKRRIPGLAQDVPNYAWSFELIVPENGLLLESDGRLLEVSFDWLMAHEHAGRAGRGGRALRGRVPHPLRLPRHGRRRQPIDPSATRGRTISASTSASASPRMKPTTSSTASRARGRIWASRDDIDPAAFRQALERQRTPPTRRVEVDRFVQSLPTHTHDLLLIPNGTIHGSGAGNLVLEISATPYIFTFKMYDWLRLDLEGKPRPLNIAPRLRQPGLRAPGPRVAEELDLEAAHAR